MIHSQTTEHEPAGKVKVEPTLGKGERGKGRGAGGGGGDFANGLGEAREIFYGNPFCINLLPSNSNKAHPVFEFSELLECTRRTRTRDIKKQQPAPCVTGMQSVWGGKPGPAAVARCWLMNRGADRP